MSKKKILLITQDMDPYTALSEIADISNKLAPYLNGNQCELRILMPKFGTVNERRHRLHEVVRLSGMNIIVNDDDYPLIIKVASLDNTRIQVYFLDNDEFFSRKNVFEDEDGKAYEDNLERAVFFCKSSIETVKKFGWAPDIIHCHGWMTSLIPLYLRTAYRNDPLFMQAKIIYSLYNPVPNTFSIAEFQQKAAINNLSADDMIAFNGEDGNIDIHKGAFIFADGVVKGSEELSEGVLHLLDENTEKPVLEHLPLTDPSVYLPTYPEFYKAVEAIENNVVG